MQKYIVGFKYAFFWGENDSMTDHDSYFTIAAIENVGGIHGGLSGIAVMTCHAVIVARELLASGG